MPLHMNTDHLGMSFRDVKDIMKKVIPLDRSQVTVLLMVCIHLQDRLGLPMDIFGFILLQEKERKQLYMDIQMAELLENGIILGVGHRVTHQFQLHGEEMLELL